MYSDHLFLPHTHQPPKILAHVKGRKVRVLIYTGIGRQKWVPGVALSGVDRFAPDHPHTHTHPCVQGQGRQGHEECRAIKILTQYIMRKRIGDRTTFTINVYQVTSPNFIHVAVQLRRNRIEAHQITNFLKNSIAQYASHVCSSGHMRTHGAS